MRRGKVVIADDEPANRSLLGRFMTRLGCQVVATANGQQALEAVSREAPDLVILDINMPLMDGFEVCRRIKAEPSTRLLPVILVTGLTAVEERIKGIDAGADDFLSKPFVAAELEARAGSLIRLKRYTDELDSAESVIMSLALTIEARDPYTRGHCERLARYAAALGTELGLSEAERVALYRGGYLHDVGKVGIPDSILLKPTALTVEECVVMQRHTVIGEALCGDLKSLADVRAIIRHHHERLDGSGYPDRLAGSEIPVLAQIMNVVDAYDAMTTDRPYRLAITPMQAIEELRADARRGWKDAALVEAFVGLVLNGLADEVRPSLPTPVARAD